MTKAHTETRAQVRGVASVVVQDPAQAMAAAMVQDLVRILAQAVVLVRVRRLEILVMVMDQGRIPIPVPVPVVALAVLPAISGSNRLMATNRVRRVTPRPLRVMHRNLVRVAILRDRRRAIPVTQDMAIHRPVIGTTTTGMTVAEATINQVLIL